MLLAWHKYGGGKELLEKLYASIGANVVSFPYGPMPTQPLGWFKKPVTKAEDLQGIKFRTVGISIDVFTGLGAAVNALPGGEIVSAMDRGLLDAAEFNNASSDRILGFPDVSKVCMLQSYHQNAEQFEIMFNKTKYDALPEKMRAIIAVAAEAAGQDMAWKAIDRYSKDYEELQTKDKVKFYKTPDSILQQQLEIYDQVVEKKSADNPLFKEIVESQMAFAKRATQWEQDTVVSRRMAYNHYFGPNAKQEDLTRIIRASNASSGIAIPDDGFYCRHPVPTTVQPAARTLMNAQRFLHTIDGISTWFGKAAAWLIIGLMLLVCAEVFKRYILNMPTAWIFDAPTCCTARCSCSRGAYTLAQNAHVRGDFLYSSMRPRTQASLDLVLYIVFFLPGIAALAYAGWDYASHS